MNQQPMEFYVAGGTLPPDAPSYIVRAADETLYAGLKAEKFCYVLTPRQMGKSSLMHQTARRLRAEGCAVVTLDLSKLGTNLTLDQWYFGLLRAIGQQLRMQPELAAHWEQQAALSPLQRLFTALEERIAPACPSGLILFVDEIDIVRRLPFSADEFFAAIRERHNARDIGPERRPVTFCLLGVASPGDLISDPRTTPFNIGLRIELTDFTADEAAPLAEGLGVGNSGVGVGDQSPSGILSPPSDAQRLLARVLYWTGGHPYLTQRLCLDLAEQARSGAPMAVDRRCAALFFGSRARQEETNLAFVQNTLLHLSADVAGLLELYRRIRRGRRVPDDPTSPQVNLLCLSGLAHPQHGWLFVRNRIYKRVFDVGWIEASMPHAELRRQRAAYWRGALRTLALATLVLAAVGGLAWNALRNARRADIAARLATKNAQLYLAERDTAQRKTVEANLATDKAQKATERAERAARQRKTALDLATNARFHERDAQLKTLSMLSEAQADRGAQELRNGDATGLLDLAESCRTVKKLPTELESRSALWSCWYAACAADLEQMIQQEKPITAMQFMPRTGNLVTGSIDGIVRFWNAKTGRETGRRRIRGGPVDTLALSPDGRYVAVSTHHDWTDEGSVELWDPVTGRSIQIDLPAAQKSLNARTDERTINQIVFTPDSRQLAVAALIPDYPDAVVWLFDTTTGAPQYRFLCRGWIRSIEFAHSAPIMMIETQSDVDAGAAYLIDIRAHHLMQKSVVERASALSENGRFIVMGGSHQLRVYEGAGVDFAISAFSEHIINQIAVQPAGAFVAVATDNQLIVFSFAKYLKDPRVREVSQVYSLNAEAEPFQVFKFSPDGRSLAIQSAHGVSVYRLDKLNSMQRIVNYEGIDQIEFAPDSAALAVRTGSVVRLWRLDPRKTTSRSLGFGRPAVGVVVSPDGRNAAMIDDAETARVWQIATGAPVGPPLPGPGGHGDGFRRLMTMQFTRDGAHLLVVGRDWHLRCWDWRSGKLLWKTLKQERDIRALAVSPDGRRVATAAGQQADYCMVRQWDARTGSRLGEFREPDIANDMAYSPDGASLVMVGRAHFATIRASATGAPIGQPLRHDAEIESVAWSRDGRRVVTGSRDNTAQVWDARTGRSLGPPLRHRDWVKVVAYGPGDRYIATACQNGIVQLWDASKCLPIGTPMDHNGMPTNQLIFSPNGRLLFTGDGHVADQRLVSVWETPSGRPAGYRLSQVNGVNQFAISPDGRFLLGCPNAGRAAELGTQAPTALLWRIPPTPNLSPGEIERRTKALLGFRRNAQGFVESMSPKEWRRLRAQLASAPQTRAAR